MPAVHKGTDPGLSSGQPTGVLAATQTMGQSGQGTRERMEVSGTAASCGIYPASPVLIPEHIRQQLWLKVTGCEINWAVSSIFQHMNYPESPS